MISHGSDAWLRLASRGGAMQSRPDIRVRIGIVIDGKSAQGRSPSAGHDSESPIPIATPLPTPIPGIPRVWPCLNGEGSTYAPAMILIRLLERVPEHLRHPVNQNELEIAAQLLRDFLQILLVLTRQHYGPNATAVSCENLLLDSADR
jgi:hypothetical protein